MKKEYDLKKMKNRPGRVKVDADAAKVPVSIRLDGSVLASLRSDAERLGIPYQTHIGSILHQFVKGELIDRKTIELAKKIRAS